MNKYYVKLNQDNEIIRPYSDKSGFVPPSDTLEITHEQLNIYLECKTRGKVVSLVDGEIVSYDQSLSPTNIKESSCNKIKTLLSKTDSTQLLDSRLTIEKQQEFAVYREELRALLKGLENGSVLTVFEFPDLPKYN
jgi:hypothetical protein